MSKGKDEGGPYRAQGPGVPPDSPPREVPDPIFAEVLGQVLRGGLRPPMKRIEPVKVRWVPVTYTVEGKAGELQQVSRPIFFRFRAEEFFAMDTSSPRSTRASLAWKSIFRACQPRMAPRRASRSCSGWP